MHVSRSELGCCCLTQLSGFPYDAANDAFTKHILAQNKDTLKTLNSNWYLAVVNRDQMKSKAQLEEAGFVVLYTMKSKDDGRAVYLMGKGFDLRKMEPKTLRKRIFGK